MIDGSFTSNTAVYIGKQGSRNLYEGNTTHESSGGKTSHVSNHPTSEGDQPGLSVGRAFQQEVINACQVSEGFVLLPIRDYTGRSLKTILLKFRSEQVWIQPLYSIIGHHNYLASVPLLEYFGQRCRPVVGSNGDLVTSTGQIYSQFLHQSSAVGREIGTKRSRPIVQKFIWCQTSPLGWNSKRPVTPWVGGCFSKVSLRASGSWFAG